MNSRLMNEWMNERDELRTSTRAKRKKVEKLGQVYCHYQLNESVFCFEYYYFFWEFRIDLRKKKQKNLLNQQVNQILLPRTGNIIIAIIVPISFFVLFFGFPRKTNSIFIHPNINQNNDLFVCFINIIGSKKASFLFFWRQWEILKISTKQTEQTNECDTMVEWKRNQEKMTNWKRNDLWKEKLKKKQDDNDHHKTSSAKWNIYPKWNIVFFFFCSLSGLFVLENIFSQFVYVYRSRYVWLIFWMFVLRFPYFFLSFVSFILRS